MRGPSDLKLGFRMLVRRPIVAAGAVLSLALGIGANTAIFSVLHSVVLNPLPYRAPEELVVVWETSPENPERWVAPANFADWRRETTSFASLAAFDIFRPTLTRGGPGVTPGEPEVVRAVSASGTLFTTLGISAAMGRTLLPEDDAAGASAVAVLSDGLWARAFGGTRDVLGRTVMLDGRPHTIVGIMPSTFEQPMQTTPVDVWVSGDRGIPRTFPFGGDLSAVRDSHIIFVLGRLRAGVTRDMAQQELASLMQELARRHPDTNTGLGATVKPLHLEVVGDVSRLLTLLQLAVVMMLMIACANVAHLLLGQAVTRYNEMATRVALGASRGRLVRQSFAETLLIAVPGGVLGLLFAFWALEMLVAFAPQGLPRVSEIAIDRTVLAFTSMVTLATAALFGLGPAWQHSRDTSIAHAQSTTRISGARRVRRWHHAIVIVELAGAHVLLIGAGLLVTSLLAAQDVPLGFESRGRVAADLNLAADRYLVKASPDANNIVLHPKVQFVDGVLSRIRQVPGVKTAAAAFTSPLSGAPNRGIAIEGRPATNPALGDTADFQAVTPEFFHGVGATLIRGRDFTAADTAATAKVAIVNQTFVDRYFASQDPIGRRVRFGGDLEHEIVGVVGDMRYRSVESAADATFYVPLTQNAERWPFLSFIVATDGDARAAIAGLQSAIRAADPAQAIMRVRTFDDILATALAPRRFNTLLVVVFAATALVLAAIGTYGVMSFAVTVRTREFGVRAAIGATPGALIRLMLRHGAVVIALAVLLGLAGSIATAGLLQNLLFGVTPRDPATFVFVAMMLSAIAALATWVPARRVVAADPVRALRDE